MPPDALFLAMPVWADLLFMKFLTSLGGAGSSQARRCKSRPRRPKNAGSSPGWRGHGGDDDDSLGERRLVRQGDVDAGRHARRRQLIQPAQRPAGQPHRRLSRRQVDDTQVAPEDAVAKAGSERLRASLLGGKPTGIARRPIGAPVALQAFDVSKNPLEKAVAKARDRLLDPADVDQVAAEPEYHRRRRAGRDCFASLAMT